MMSIIEPFGAYLRNNRRPGRFNAAYEQNHLSIQAVDNTFVGTNPDGVYMLFHIVGDGEVTLLPYKWMLSALDSIPQYPLSWFTIPGSVVHNEREYTVKYVQQFAFNDLNSFFSDDVTFIIGHGVEYIGQNCFNCLENLRGVALPESLKEISYMMFADCPSLFSIHIPDEVTSIGDVAFGNCYYLTTVDIPASVTKIGHGPWRNCIKLKAFSINENNKYYTVRDGVLYTKDMHTLVQYPAGRTDEEFKIPPEVVEIAGSAFYGNPYLKCVVLSPNVTSISHAAFKDCTALSDVVIPKTVSFIGNAAFEGCTNLKEIKIPANATYTKTSSSSFPPTNNITTY